MVNQFGGNGMVVGLAAVTHALHLLIHQPLGPGPGDAAAVGEVLIAVGPFVVETGVDHDNITLLNRWCGIFQILGSNHAPLLFGDGYRHTGPAQAPQGIVADPRRIFGHMNGRIHVGTAMHNAFPVDLVNAIFGVEFIHRNINPRAGRPLRHMLMERMA